MMMMMMMMEKVEKVEVLRCFLLVVFDVLLFPFEKNLVIKNLLLMRIFLFIVFKLCSSTFAYIAWCLVIALIFSTVVHE